MINWNNATRFRLFFLQKQNKIFQIKYDNQFPSNFQQFHNSKVIKNAEVIKIIDRILLLFPVYVKLGF